MNRRHFIIGSFSSAVLLTTTGCLTKKYYESYDASLKYDDTVISFLITEDGSKLVVLSEKFHYIFDTNPQLKRILLGSFRPMVTAYFDNFYVTRDNMITGDYTLFLSGEATDEQKKNATDAGFMPYGNTLHELSGHLEGTRYSAEGFPSIAQSYKFNRPYDVRIREEPSAAKVTEKILLTPIVVLADGVLILAGAALVLLMMGGGGGGR